MIAVIDDEPLVRSATSSLLRSLGYDCRTFGSADDFLQDESSGFACIVSDIQMPGTSGLALAETLRARPRRVPVILMTAFPSARSEMLRASGAICAVVLKPLDGDLLDAHVREALALAA